MTKEELQQILTSRTWQWVGGWTLRFDDMVIYNNETNSVISPYRIIFQQGRFCLITNLKSGFTETTFIIEVEIDNTYRIYLRELDSNECATIEEKYILPSK